MTGGGPPPAVADDMPDVEPPEDRVALVSADATFQVGNPVDTVKIDIDYAIIKHFSEHLYSSPNKAIEELVSNGFDALATLCYVYVPGAHVQNRVIVWDNGLSMDPARSPGHVADRPQS